MATQKTTPVTPASTRPLWQRLALRRLKFLGFVAIVLAVVLGGSYLFAPQWLLSADIKRQAMAAHVDKHSVQVGDTNWVYYEGGEGPTLLMLHGFAASKEVWMKQMEQLSPHFHVIAPDLPGWGESSRVDGASYNIDAQASRLQAFIEALHLPKVVLIGHSMGGAIAGVYAAEHPEHVAELALLDSFGLKANENDFSRTAMSGKNVFLFDNREQFAQATAWAFAKPLNIPGRFQDVLIARNQKDRAFLEHTFNELRDPSQYLSLQSRLDKLQMPVLGLWCHDDKIIDISALDSLRNGLKNASGISTSMLTGCNHMPIVEKPEETARIITQFALSH
ncbi:Pimeloyl-ACP methyl ester carboxylesterase [Dyella jiangningensis]|uniref:alpha/beta fold hydrolase n=1 Tax=Dyella sp. AtDHG13 TaxID=1938897 RepID=UPI00087FAC09|nr:alpha/beta fold hydrolase [Dyella sp. AtDHG13]PXV55349.1 pimeloyl-ACP methyl ester carboxylesterase [Dyella sp. AtDHG13]SDK79788.1 Pimeloyl-ACP methyl ester carboxylesterase [Dyella jiangningensis]